ncbi:hypothetical protein R6Z07F_000680 [Ovis aries]
MKTESLGQCFNHTNREFLMTRPDEKNGMDNLKIMDNGKGLEPAHGVCQIPEAILDSSKTVYTHSMGLDGLLWRGEESPRKATLANFNGKGTLGWNIKVNTVLTGSPEDQAQGKDQNPRRPTGSTEASPPQDLLGYEPPLLTQWCQGACKGAEGEVEVLEEYKGRRGRYLRIRRFGCP